MLCSDRPGWYAVSARVHDCCIVEGYSQDADDLTRVLEMVVV